MDETGSAGKRHAYLPSYMGIDPFWKRETKKTKDDFLQVEKVAALTTQAFYFAFGESQNMMSTYQLIFLMCGLNTTLSKKLLLS